MNITVYHAKKPNFGYLHIGEDPKFPDEFSVVATVGGILHEKDMDTEAILNHVFRHTNHVEEDWNNVFNKTMQEILEVDNCLVKTDERSTSVGDVIRIEILLEEQFYRVASIGFEKLVTKKVWEPLK